MGEVPGQRTPQKPKIERAVDNYLDHYQRSREAMEHVAAVLTKFDHMVSLASERALDELYTPDNVYQMYPRGGAIPYGGDNVG